MSFTPRIISKSELSVQDAKWITLQKIKYSDAEGKERVWECAERKTRKSTGVDGAAVAIMALIKSRSKAFPVSTVIIEQFRPPIGKYIIEFPAGLIDEGDTVQGAAIRELEEETGFKADSIHEVSDLIVSDPGMTTANMKFVIANVTLEDKLSLPKQKLEVGEFIIPRIVELSKLHGELQGSSELHPIFNSMQLMTRPSEYAKKDFVVDAKLSHFAMGFNLANQIQKGDV